MRRKANYTWQDYKTNKDNLSEIKINPAVKTAQNYRNKWVIYVVLLLFVLFMYCLCVNVYCATATG
jgi:hypothetical protein